MAQFEEKDCYMMEVDQDKNRLNLTFLGHWQSPADIPYYLEHVAKSVGMLKKGYTIYAEINDKKPPKLSVTGIHKKGQQIMKQAGVSKTAVVLKQRQILQKMTLNVVGRLSGMSTKVFYDKDEALKWLEGE